MSTAREQARADRTRGRRSHAVPVHEHRSHIELYAALPSCRHCGFSVEYDARSPGGLLVHVGTRSRRCAGVDADTEAELAELPEDP